MASNPKLSSVHCLQHCSPLFAAYIYHPEEEKCYASYEQGPCSPGDILILPAGKVIPVCVPNVCYNTGQVQFVQAGMRKICVTLGRPCVSSTWQRVYGVNATTLKVECLAAPKGGDYRQPPTLAPDTEGITAAPTTPSYINIKGARSSGVLVETALDKECTPGCKRAQNNQCPPETTQR